MPIKTRIVEPSPLHAKFYDAVNCAMAEAERDGMTPQEMLAITAQIAGKLLAIQDSTLMTVEEGIMLVMANLEAGNKQMAAELEMMAAERSVQ